MTATVAVIGEGRLADRTCDRLDPAFRIVRQLDLRDGAPPSADLALVLSDGWNAGLHERAEAMLRQSGIPWLRAFVWFGEGVVGPWSRPDRPGCSQCADYRKILAGGDRRETWMLKQQTAARSGAPQDPWASDVGFLHLSRLVADEAGRWLQKLPVRTEDRLYLINLTTLTLTRHFVLPDPLCPVCGELREDSAETASIKLRPNPKSSPGSYRTKPMKALEASLEADYVDRRTGLLNAKVYDLQSPYADATVNLPLFEGDEGAAGRTHRYSDSVLTAILEGLERQCGTQPRGKLKVVRDSYRRLGDQALDPLTVGVHAPDQYRIDNFPFRPFDPDREIDWVWGYSFLRERPILVPEQLAYYSIGFGEGFVYETSNGCALGGSLEEAIFYGILELAERDSFLMTWYAKLPLQKIDPATIGDSETALMIERLRVVTGYEFLLFDATMEHGIPCIWTMAKNIRSQGVNLICAAGAHPDPIRAVKGSIHELAAMALSQNGRFEAHREQFVRMLDDPYQVRHMEDHSMLYALPEAESRFDFLLRSGQPPKTFEEVYGKPGWRPDLTDDLNGLLQAFRQLDMDVIVVDQSSPETLRNGLYCVKVIIPGLLPMTFGYHLTRLQGLERVLKVPAKLGYAKEPLTYGQLNPHPHPFP
ncbi:TOMM precursor leader peptide-binding protein [Cohnella candidum]|uniref:Bacteriocin biosynthesis protein SagD n=1 Tax=Cohnella candidum TaxID=2674991 RepID=A0A3G3JVG0_9BACL|nr:TOMM precursor leader peptide-binding protein [Cohnella candidum]AYQ72233.1 bacteriocin biosynthesis protein SagD [Cohnella candidum]